MAQLLETIHSLVGLHSLHSLSHHGTETALIMHILLVIIIDGEFCHFIDMHRLLDITLE